MLDYIARHPTHEATHTLLAGLNAMLFNITKGPDTPSRTPHDYLPWLPAPPPPAAPSTRGERTKARMERLKAEMSHGKRR